MFQALDRYIEKNKDKLDVIRDIIRETALGNIAVGLLIASITFVKQKMNEGDAYWLLFQCILCINSTIIVFWLMMIVYLYLKKLTKNAVVKLILFFLWFLSAEAIIGYSIFKYLVKAY